MSAQRAQFVSSNLRLLANSKKAKAIQAYMKTTMPCYGVAVPDIRLMVKNLLTEHPISDFDDYKSTVTDLWALKHREEKYAAIYVATAKSLASFVGDTRSISLYEKMIRVDYAWWDFVDTIATHGIGPCVLSHKITMGKLMDKWIDDENMWIRRSAILHQLSYKDDQIDEERLFSYSLKRAHENEFFIQKAIGWALRDHARVRPASVIKFLNESGPLLSPLSIREAAKHLPQVKVAFLVEESKENRQLSPETTSDGEHRSPHKAKAILQETGLLEQKRLSGGKNGPKIKECTVAETIGKAISQESSSMTDREARLYKRRRLQDN